MRDHTYDSECEAVRDELPELLRARRGGEYDRIERHVAKCEACALELAMLREARAAVVAGAPALDVAAVAAAVREATAPRHPAGLGVADRGPALVPPRVRAPGQWRVRRSVAGFVASVLVAVGAGAVWRASDAPVSGTGRGVVPGLPASVAHPSTEVALTPARGPVASAEQALGERFDDLDDEELQAVVAAVEGSDRGLPTVEPDADVLAGEVEGG
jgi:hypothetical protein